MFDCNFYMGMVGWCDVEGDGEWIIVFCCVEVEIRFFRFFVGVGIVVGLKLEDELDEILVKFCIMFWVMGLY